MVNRGQLQISYPSPDRDGVGGAMQGWHMAVVQKNEHIMKPKHVRRWEVRAVKTCEQLHFKKRLKLATSNNVHGAFVAPLLCESAWVDSFKPVQPCVREELLVS